ncbi:MAG: type II secretion system protein [Terrimicrobiaceae bacterium]
MRGGFSLVELMAGMGIVAMLAAVVLPAVSAIGPLADNTRCVSNLRQIGQGILAYAQDHDGTLPGPLISAQYPYWETSWQITWHLRDYLELDKTRGKTGRADVFMCPAYLRAGRKAANFKPYNSPVYGMNIQVPMEGETRVQQPFGYANSWEPNTFRQIRDYPPMRLADLDRIRDAQGRPARSTTWAMRDVDRQDGRFDGLGTPSILATPATPVHGDRRNALFFDFHVGAMPTNKQQL